MTMAKKQKHHLHPFKNNMLSVLLPLTVLILLCDAFAIAHGASDVGGSNTGRGTAKESHHKDSWYTRYPAYPQYCSIPSEMESRKIPPLNADDDDRIGETRIVHVTSIIRHGARTPYFPHHCWDGYLENPETGVWNCDLTTILAPPTPQKILQEEGNEDTPANGVGNAMFLFEKKYDALLTGSHEIAEEYLSNYLNGTCELGQLLLQGYEQELSNGRILRDTYLYDGTSMDHDIRMRLIDLTKYKNKDDKSPLPFAEPLLKYRSDDDQRTLMSGQVLLRGLFGEEFIQHEDQHGTQPTIPLHVADRDKDILACNSWVCPRLVELETEALQSKEYQTFNTSKETKFMNKFISTELGSNGVDMEWVDCLMTTICTDRTLPEAVNDFVAPEKESDEGDTRFLHNGHHHEGDDSDDSSDDTSSSDDSNGDNSKNMFQRLRDWDVTKQVFQYLYNNAAYSKLGMKPLWREIFHNMSPILHPEKHGRSNNNNLEGDDTTKLALFSGHDTTIIPIMATLGEKLWNVTDWPPYASMVLIELHEFIDFRTDKSVYKSNFAFRLLYNGRVMTSLIDGCPPNADLCDVQILESIVEPYAEKPWQCDLMNSPPISNNGPGAWAKTLSLVSSPGGFFLFLWFLLMSAAIASCVTFVTLTGRFPSLSHLTSAIKGHSILHSVNENGTDLATSSPLKENVEGHNDETNNRYHDDPIYDEGQHHYNDDVGGNVNYNETMQSPENYSKATSGGIFQIS